MKLIVKTLGGKIIPVEVEATDSVAQFKTKIEAQDSTLIASAQKLIHFGKVMEDAKTLQEYAIKENDFVVAMVTKAKPEPAAAAVPAPVAAATPAPASAATTSVAAAPATPANTGAAVATPGAPARPAAPAAVDPQFEAGVAHLMEMGFPKSDCERALRAAFMNIDRAAEYLTSGAPIADPTEQEAELMDTGAEGEAEGEEGAEGDDGEDPLAFLRNDPQFAQMRTLVRTNPQLLQPLLQQLGQANPALMAIIAQNQEAFMDLINDDEGAPAGARAAQSIQVTPEEHAAIERLEALGFPRARVVQAYFACDKNENLAANFLFDTMADDQ